METLPFPPKIWVPKEASSASCEGERELVDLLRFGDFGGCAVAIYPRESKLSTSILFFLSLPLSPAPPQFTSLSPCHTFFSPSPKLAQSPPSGFRDGQDSWVPSPHALPHCPGPGHGVSSSLLAGTQHDLGDEVDNGGGRLVGIKLSEEVAGVVRGAALLPGHKAEEPAGAGEG